MLVMCLKASLELNFLVNFKFVFYFSDIFSPQFLGNMDQGVVINLIKKVRPCIESLTVYKGDGAALYGRGLNVKIFRRFVLQTVCG